MKAIFALLVISLAFCEPIDKEVKIEPVPFINCILTNQDLMYQLTRVINAVEQVIEDKNWMDLAVVIFDVFPKVKDDVVECLNNSTNTTVLKSVDPGEVVQCILTDSELFAEVTKVIQAVETFIEDQNIINLVSALVSSVPVIIDHVKACLGNETLLKSFDPADVIQCLLTDSELFAEVTKVIQAVETFIEDQNIVNLVTVLMGSVPVIVDHVKACLGNETLLNSVDPGEVVQCILTDSELFAEVTKVIQAVETFIEDQNVINLVSALVSSVPVIIDHVKACLGNETTLMAVDPTVVIQCLMNDTVLFAEVEKVGLAVLQFIEDKNIINLIAVLTTSIPTIVEHVQACLSSDISLKSTDVPAFIKCLIADQEVFDQVVRIITAVQEFLKTKNFMDLAVVILDVFPKVKDAVVTCLDNSGFISQ